MQQRYPCPKEGCEHWNPADRDECFRCKEDLSSVDVKKLRRKASTGPSPLVLLIGAAAVAAIVFFAILQLRGRAVKSDTVKPTLALQEPSGTEVHTSEDTLTISGTVADEHPKEVVANGTTAPVEDGRFTLELPVSGDEMEVRVVARDMNGNESLGSVFRVLVDREAPEIVELEPQDGASVVTKTVNVKGTASEPLGSVEVNGTEATVDGMSFSAQVDLSEGENTIRVVAKDKAGLEAERELGVTYSARRLPTGLTTDGRTASGDEIFRAAKDSSRLVLVPGGTFSMGNEASSDADEKPVHEVTLTAYFIDLQPVTNAQYRAFAEGTGRRMPSAPAWDRGYLSKDDMPVVNVSWTDARDYAEWAGRRLPTEAEWELAARGTSGRTYPWGDEAPDATRANTKGSEDGHANASPVGAFAAGASPYGLADMAGNVWEWTADRYSASYYRSSPAEDPQGPSGGSQRTTRGGSFKSGGDGVRASNRYALAPSSKKDNVGFRTATSFPTN